MKDKYQTIFQYQSVMAWVRSLLNDGIITQSEYNKIDTNIAKKYGISSCSIYRSNNLLSDPLGGNMSHNKEVA